ncbi:MAG: paraquat-inducible protein A [Candidatus Dechloromonas phosphoritropha]|jgi:paraquat-inducible protein A
MSPEALVVCHECDLLLREVPLEAGGVARCTRCGCDLYRHQPESLERSLVFALTAAVLFVIANSFPIVSMNSRGLTSSTTLLGAVSVLLHDDMPSVALLVFITTFLMPALEIGALIYLLLPLKLGHVPPAVPHVFRLMHAAQPWSMVEVFMLGLLVTISKLAAMASVVPDIALWSFVLLMFAVAAAVAGFDVRIFWARVRALQ